MNPFFVYARLLSFLLVWSTVVTRIHWGSGVRGCGVAELRGCEVWAEFFGYGVMGVTAVHHDGVQLYSRRFTASKTCWVCASIFVCVYFCLCRPLRGLPVCPLLPGQNSPEMGVGFLATWIGTCERGGQAQPTQLHPPASPSRSAPGAGVAARPPCGTAADTTSEM